MKKLLTLSAAAIVCAAFFGTAAPAAAQCADCALYPDRDHLNGGVQTPAAKGIGQPGGAANNAGAAPPNTVNNANAGIRGHYLKQSGKSFDSKLRKK
jgi:hypothetical protein